MKITRRTGLGAMLGGAVSAISGSNRPMVNPPPTGYYGGAEAKQLLAKDSDPVQATLNHAKYIREETERLTKLISGDFSDEWHKNELDYTDYSKEEARIESLKSISSTIKSELMLEYDRQRKKQAWINQAQKELANLLRFK